MIARAKTILARISNKSRTRTIPTASGGISRIAYTEAKRAGADVAAILRRCGMTFGELNNPSARITVSKQVKFLNLTAAALDDTFLGIHLAQRIDLRELGLLYYVQASSALLRDALRSLARYSKIHNEGVHIGYREGSDITITFEYVGVARHGDRHQIEFIATSVIRLCQHFTGRRLAPSAIRLVHRGAGNPALLRAIFGCDVAFGSDVDVVSYAASVARLPIINADPFLNRLLTKYCEEALASRRKSSSSWRLRIENAIAPQLPHGRIMMSDICERVGVSRRTLARRLAEEGVTYSEVLNDLRLSLGQRYLEEPQISITEVAWLLGFSETSAFDRAFKRWTGKSPKQSRQHLSS
jgi:AraC-like DNA-binding protein